MASKKKQAKFFCEFCDSEVPAKARFCPKCGHFFLSVRCPVCGKTGSHEEFENGCPQCGYAFNGSPEEFKQNKKISEEQNHHIQNNNAIVRKRKNDDALPVWIYIATFTVFAGIILFVISQCKS